MDVPRLEDYLAALGHAKTPQKLSMEDALSLIEDDWSLKDHYDREYLGAKKYDERVNLPLELYLIDLTPDLFSRLLIQQLGDKKIQADLMPRVPDSMLAKSVSIRMKQKGLDISAFRPGGSHHCDWTEKVAVYHDMLDSTTPPFLMLTLPFEEEKNANPNVSFFISDGNHRVLAASVYHYLGGGTLPQMKAIVARGDRRALQDKFKIKI
jgi:hypothetical protein